MIGTVGSSDIARAAVSGNLVGSSWNTIGSVERANGMVTLRETSRESAHAYQDFSVSQTSGNRLLLISYTRAESVRTGGDITGLPYLYGYAFNSRGIILSYLQNPSLRHAAASGSWAIASQTFSLPRRTTSLRLFF